MSLVTAERSGSGLRATYKSKDSKRLVARVASLRAEASLRVLSSGSHTGGDITAQEWNPRSNLPVEGVSGRDPTRHVPRVRGRSN